MIKGDGKIKFWGSERDFCYVSVRKRGFLGRVVGRVTDLLGSITAGVVIDGLAQCF